MKWDVYCGILNIEAVLEWLASSIEKNDLKHQSPEERWKNIESEEIAEENH